MLEYGEILEFLAKNPPQHDAERDVHASLLELVAQCLRSSECSQSLDPSSIAYRFKPEQSQEPLSSTKN